MFNKVCTPLRSQTRRCSSLILNKAKPVVELDEGTRNALEKNEIKPRKHAGVVYRRTTELPEWVTKGITSLIEEYPKQQLREDSAKFYRHFKGRHPPIEKEEFEAKFDDIKKELRQEKRYENVTPEVEEKLDKQVSSKALQVLKTNVQYSSSAVKYDSYTSILYMMTRSAPDYAILYKIFHEIKARDGDFEAKNLLDFGSGIGTVSWAAAQLWPTLKEYVCIDASTEIISLAEELAKHADPKIKGIFHRQYLPVTAVPKFDVVVSAFTLFDLPDRKSRLEVILSLWRKTERYLVLVEQGTNAGFQIINEARDFILHIIESSNKREGTPQGYIFSPCPHESKCPKIAVDDGTPCNFQASYIAFTLMNAKFSKKERYSYVVFKKGGGRDENEKKWPRLVRPTLVRSRHSICRMCIPNGKLMEVFFSVGKHERPVYYCARSSEWGDRLPIEIVSETPK
ncbi:methyltransferase-like protein 17, mitochondrial [Diachasma alloeum]|uniref:methyltransferase-like protein 17, mitochondrial n=1 Tax=Diachasma alloeum TaxID=454923 RepID=UPI00073827D8|nr:methyltransferase-like protein 17, mitochondrial [Diachasma alloeum]